MKLHHKCILSKPNSHSVNRPAPRYTANNPRINKLRCQATSTHYDVLGVQSTATEAEIKSSFRKLALKLHPDVNKEPGAQSKFIKCKEAYEVIGERESRAAYDQELLQASRRSQMPFGFDGESIVIEIYDADENDGDPFEQMFQEVSQIFSNNNFGTRPNKVSKGRRGGRGGVRQSDVEEILSGLDPALVEYARSVYGPRFEKLHDAEELIDFLSTVERLEEQGVQFDFGDSNRSRRSSGSSAQSSRQSTKSAAGPRSPSGTRSSKSNGSTSRSSSRRSSKSTTTPTVQRSYRGDVNDDEVDFDSIFNGFAEGAKVRSASRSGRPAAGPRSKRSYGEDVDYDDYDDEIDRIFNGSNGVRKPGSRSGSARSTAQPRSRQSYQVDSDDLGSLFSSFGGGQFQELIIDIDALLGNNQGSAQSGRQGRGKSNSNRRRS